MTAVKMCWTAVACGVFVGVCVASQGGAIVAGTAAQERASSEREVVLTASSANVAESGSPVRIQIFRWSTDEERKPVVEALNVRPEVTDPEAAARGRGARGGGGRGRGGRGRGEPAAPLTPTAALTAAVGRAPTIGYIWTAEVTGYSIKYAYRVPRPDGGERIILVTDRRFGAHAPAWRLPSDSAVTDYEFTLIELRLSPDGVGEGRTSLTTRVIVDNEAGTVALDDYGASITIFRDVRRGEPQARGGA